MERKGGDRGADKAFRKHLCEQEVLACCRLCPVLDWEQEMMGVGWGGFEAISQSQQVQAMEQEFFICTLGFLQNTQLIFTLRSV